MTILPLLVLLGFQQPSMRGGTGPAKPLPSRTYPERNEEYRKRLLAMLEKDQEIRTKTADLFKNLQAGQAVPPAYRAELDKLSRTSNEIAAELKKLMGKHGWPGYRKVGRDATAAACMLVQNMDKQVSFQKYFLDGMKKAVEEGEADRSELAFMTDRVLVAEKKKQRYGTMISVNGNKIEPLPIEDPKNLDNRRAEMGLGLFADYLEEVRARYGRKP